MRYSAHASWYPVALLAEGVDRNFAVGDELAQLVRVALLAEGVDRNTVTIRKEATAAASPSSRRAWIEIRRGCRSEVCRRSPSSRRAWIEIIPQSAKDKRSKSSPSSRRAWIEIEGKAKPM